MVQFLCLYFILMELKLFPICFRMWSLESTFCLLDIFQKQDSMISRAKDLLIHSQFPDFLSSLENWVKNLVGGLCKYLYQQVHFFTPWVNLIPSYSSYFSCFSFLCCMHCFIPVSTFKSTFWHKYLRLCFRFSLLEVCHVRSWFSGPQFPLFQKWFLCQF